MKEKKTRRWLSLLLTVVMVLSLLPAAALPVSAANADTPYRIVHLDCGRKYFSVANIEKLIDTMAQYGYNQLQLAFGNGGCRFLLDDMSLSFTADGTEDGTKVEMPSESVKANITAGNDSFNKDTRYLTQDDMDEIIRYADEKGIGIVPMLNMPGHATAIVYGTDYNSNGNLNINNAAAREYGYALLEKYVTYFKAKGCSFFHFGADESGYTGDNMTTFLSGCAKVITDAGMTPRAFNDATDVANMPKDVQITYWHRESGSKTASALEADYDLINTHGRWYYVIKTAQNSEIDSKYWQGKVHSAETSVELPVMKAEKMDNKWVGINEYFDGNHGSGSTISSSLGTMFCIWCDASQDEYLTDSDVISENENYGALYQLEKLAEHYWPEDIKKDTTAPVVKVDGGSKVPSKMAENGTLTLTADKSVTWETSDPDVIDLLSSANDTAITGTTVTMSRLYSSSSIANGTTITGTTVTAVAQKPGIATITVTDENKNTARHTIEVTAAAADTEQTVTLEVGESATFDTTADVGDCVTADRYIATANVTEGMTQAASVEKVTSTITSGKKYLITMSHENNGYVVTNITKTFPSTSSDWNGAKGLVIEGQTIGADNADALKDYAWTITESGNGYTVVDKSGKYLSINDNNNVTLSADKKILTLTPSGGKFTFARQGSNIYLDNFGGSEHPSYNTFASAWEQKDSAKDNNLWTLYEITEGTSGSNNVLTITGTGEGDTTAKIGDVNYTINVTAPTTTANNTLPFGGSFALPAGVEATVTSGSEYVTVEDGKVTAGQTAGTATVNAEVKNNGGKVTARYTYNITVSNVNWDKVEPLPVQLWITNTYVSEDKGSTGLQTININARDACSDQGVLLEDLVPARGYKKDGGEEVRVTFWKGTALNTAPTLNGADLSGKGQDFTHIRYWNNSWQYKYNNGWLDFNVGTQTIVAYYLQINVVSPEITTGSKDYGNPPTNHPGSTSTKGYALTAFAVVYPDNTLSRTEQEMYETGMVRGFWDSSEFGIGTFFAENNSNYKISKMTVTWGRKMGGDISGNGWYTENKTGTYGTNWGVQWEKEPINNAGDKWFKETTYWKEGDSDIPMIDGDANGLKFNTTDHQAVLILIYIEPVEKKENLNVVYWDDSHGKRINTKDIQIVVKEGVTFTDKENGLKQTSLVPTTGGSFILDDDAYIVNSSSVKQRINKTVSILEDIDEHYKSGLYKYVSADISADGKTLTLHYRVQDPKKFYVIDFGLPLHIKMSDVIENAEDLSNVAAIGTPIYGNVTYDRTKQEIIYTPTKVLLGKQALLFRLTFQNKVTEDITIGVVPASNVLYEDRFMTAESGNLVSWKNGSGSRTGTNNAAQAAGDAEVYGYDKAYSEVTGTSGTAYTAWVNAENAYTNNLTFSFAGTGFDLIGACGPDTGTVLVRVEKGSTFYKGYLVNTALKDDDLGTIYQVPLVHAQDWDYGTYKVTVIGAYVDYGTSMQTMTAALSLNDGPSAANGADPAGQLYDLMDAAGMPEEEMDDVELIDMDQLYGTTTMAAQTAVETDTSAQADMNIEIDGFRVYDQNHTYDGFYADSEKNAKYTNVIEATLNGNFQAYAENQQSKTWEDLKTYQNSGGPQNEVYLSSGQAIAFKVDPSAGIQISARKVTNLAASMVANGAATNINSNTEMYYRVTADPSGVVTIRNDGTGMLALGNLKLVNGTTKALTAEDSSIVLALLSMDPVPAFAPKLNVSAKSFKVIRNKLVTVTVHASTDVARLTINGKTVSPTNGLLVKRGWSKEYIYLFTDTVKRDVSKTYEIIAYNADGTASAPVQVTG